MNKLLLLILVFALLTGTASAQHPITFNNYFYNSDTRTAFFQNIGTVRLVSINQDLTFMEEIFEIIPSKSVRLQRSMLNARFNKLYGSDITSITWLYLNISTIMMNVTDYGVVKRSKIDYNNTTKENETIWYDSYEVIGTHNELRDNFVWEPFPKSINIVSGNVYNLKIIYTKKAEIGTVKIQTIPAIFNIEIPEFTWWNYSWSNRIDNALADGVRPYQISLNVSNSTGTNNATHVYCNGKCNVDFTDIRFTLDNTTALSYWIEDNATGKVWVNVTANGTANMYYGNPSAQSTSNGTLTFPFFDEFLGLSVDTTKWTIKGGTPAVSASELTLYDATVNEGIVGLSAFAQNHAIRARLKNTGTGQVGGIGFSAGTAADFTGSVPYSGIYKYLNTGYAENYVTGTVQVSYTWNDANYHLFDIIRNSSTNTIFIKNDIVVSTISTQMTSNSLYPHISIRASGTEIIDWVLVRNYTSTEPTWATWGIETGQDTTFNQSVYNTGWQTIFINSTQNMTSIRSMMNSSNVNWIARWNATTQKWESYKAGWSYRATNNASAGEAVYLKVTNNETVMRNNGGGNYNWITSLGWNLLGLDYNGTRTLSQVNASINSLGTCDADKIIYPNPETQVQYTYTCGLTNNETVSVNQGEGFWCNATIPISRVRVW